MIFRKESVGNWKKELMECKYYESKDFLNKIRKMSSDNDILMSNNCY